MEVLQKEALHIFVTRTPQREDGRGAKEATDGHPATAAELVLILLE